MGFAIYYRSTRQLSPALANAIRRSAAALVAGRTWLSCEPVGFFEGRKDGRLFGGSKPNFQPHPDDVAAAARSPLPDGTVRDLIDILCQLSKDFGVDWEFSHDHDPGPVGFIRGGVCEPQLRQQLEAIGDLAGMWQELREEWETPSGSSPPSPSGRGPDDGADDDAGPSILPFRPRGD